ncbi:NADP-dependent oxidoreductase [Phanerochaete sordida]|uniref:NADP-dependent oxidoreductase n=1 Tax=Phanerochaete sordida TaxID=48140 RepID=A0A9P3LE75_9APHY|nr:NADP-dependent oxidoreductase [Phanerochaete sordida]
MAPVKNGRLLFNEVPTGYPEPGKTTVYDDSQTIDLESVPLNGGVLVKILVVSVDPYLRGKMRDSSVKSYSAAFVIGEPIFNFGVGVVLRSENPSVKAGDHLYGHYPFQHYVVLPNIDSFRVLKNEENLPWAAYVGVVGMPGQTAWVGWYEFAAPQKGDVVFVTAGSGPVGSFVIQLAKLHGHKVIASAGSEDKVEFIKKIGADVAFNYKTTSTWDVLEREGPVNIYWDNVGGETLDAALQHSAKGARFIECGMISQYNSAPYTVQNLMAIVRNELHLHGFIVGSHLPKYRDEFYREVPGKIARGEIQYIEDAKKGLEWAGHAILDVQQGRNHGKSVVIVSEE